MSAVLECVGLSCYYVRERPILTDVNLEVNRGEVVAVVGLSGCGKSTLCYCLSGVIPHLHPGTVGGQVLLHGKRVADLPMAKISTQLGVVFQNPETQLFFSTVEDEVAFAPENLGVCRQEIGRRIDEALAVLGIEHLRTANPQHLSGGQKQLVVLAAVLSLQPQVLLFDEAASQIDRQGKQLILGMIRRLRDVGKTILMIEHDLNNLGCADRVLLLKEGRLEPFVGEL